MKRLFEKYPLTEEIAKCREVFWVNPRAGAKDKVHTSSVNDENRTEYASDVNGGESPDKKPIADIDGADARLMRFAPFIEKTFADAKGGIIESELREIEQMKLLMSDHEGKKESLKGSFSYAENTARLDIKGRLFLKCDSHLPVSGSIKARGGIYEILKLAEDIAMKEGGLTYDDDYSILTEDRYKKIFGKYKVAVGSTGNLGLSIGIISAALGFKVTVHMSADARQWKKDMLRSIGVCVKEYPDDYEAAVAQGRKEAAADDLCHFVDDENSRDLFEGYSVAGKRLKRQLESQGITVDENHRLYVYLPCGVGGAPGGVAWGIKQYFGDNAYCFFAEPTHAPCMTLGLVSGMKNKIAIGDVGIDGKTEADGLAVGRPSALVSDIMERELSGCFTVDDDKLYTYLAMLKDSEGIFIEPSACAAFDGLQYICSPDDKGFPAPDENSVHIVWATGGNMVPEEEKKACYNRGKANEKEKSAGQLRLEAHVERTLRENNVNQRELINGMMKSEKAGCSYEDGTITFAFPVQPWQANRAGKLHGGMISTAFDITIAALARFYAKENFAPTISLDVKFVRPVEVGDTLLVTAKAVSAGKRITQLTCEAFSKDTGKPVATGASVYLNVDTVKERGRK